MSGLSLGFAPLLPWPVLLAGAGMAALLLGLALWRGLSGWAWRAAALIVLLAALAGPSLQRATGRPLSDIVFLIDDRSASQGVSDRRAQTDRAVAALSGAVEALPGMELRRITVGDGAKNAGTELGAALDRALASAPRDRIAGALVVTDGEAHDAGLAPAFPAPVQLLLTGHRADWDRRLTIETAPAFGIIGEKTEIRLKVEDQGRVPASVGQEAQLSVSVDGGPAESYRVRAGQELSLPLTLSHGGQNVVQFTLAPTPGELTERNNSAVVQINGVRDRLRVLLVSGEPYAGERTWRNLLKSDPAVDLVHFTILRPPEKQDAVPVSELSLIAFPTRELFVDKIDRFDLIIFDRYAARGILPAEYFRNIRDYVEKGGAVLISAGPEFASVESLWHTPLGPVIPGRPTGRVLSGPFLPRPTELGLRHPVTAGLKGAPPVSGDPGAGHWGRWLRQVEIADTGAGEVAMRGAGGAPLLVLSHAGKGRVALLASDQAWLWDRGFEGGGPQLELLRRIAHWEMREPKLEEEALTADVTPGTLTMTVTRRTMKEKAGPLSVTGPDGKAQELGLKRAGPGRFAATWTAPGSGLYRLRADGIGRVVALGPASPREFEHVVASAAPLSPAVAASDGGVTWLEDGLPRLALTGAGRKTSGPGWIGVMPRGAEEIVGLRAQPLLPGWGWLLLVAGLVLAGWLAEARGKGRAG